MKHKTWTITAPDGTHTLEYRFHPFTGSITFSVDGEPFVLRGRSFQFGVARREVFRMGEEQGVLLVGMNGDARVLCGKHCTGGDTEPGKEREKETV